MMSTKVKAKIFCILCHIVLWTSTYYSIVNQKNECDVNLKSSSPEKIRRKIFSRATTKEDLLLLVVHYYPYYMNVAAIPYSSLCSYSVALVVASYLRIITRTGDTLRTTAITTTTNK